MRKIKAIGTTLATLAIAGFAASPLVAVAPSWAVGTDEAVQSEEADTSGKDSPQTEAADTAESADSVSKAKDAADTRADANADSAAEDSAEGSEDSADRASDDAAADQDAKDASAEDAGDEDASESDEEAKAKEEDKKKADAEAAIAKAAAARAKAGSAAGDLYGLNGRLASARADYEAACEAVKQVEKKIAKTEKKIAKAEDDVERAESTIAAIQREIDSSAHADLLAVLVGKATFDDIDSREYLLKKVMKDRQEALDRAAALWNKRDKLLGKLEKKLAEAQEKKKETLKAGNAAAFDVERKASKVREHDENAESALSSLDKKDDGVSRATENNKAAARSHDSTRKSVDQSVASWYELIDATPEEDNSITYGEGGDFALEEDEFVAKWGDAISAFFEGGPLAAYGPTMASAAYKYKIDPRLCAAVSIIESSGGVYCIKPHNAWGWGAADSNPYALASGWSSWEEAIESWHKGMAESKTGLATAGTLDELGAIYCSSADWSAEVADQMEKISAIADEQAVQKAAEQEAAEGAGQKQDGAEAADATEAAAADPAGQEAAEETNADNAASGARIAVEEVDLG